MVAGPNGAGKTTTANEILPDCIKFSEFVNADEIAKGIAPLHPEGAALQASKIMVRRLHELLETNKSFAFETTGAGTNYIKHLKEARTKGYELNLLFLWLPSPEYAIARVAQRVRQGGHNIPKEWIRRRYFAGLKHLFKHYLPLVDSALIYDHSSIEIKELIAHKEVSQDLVIRNREIWGKMQRAANG